jgi:hypothetical protein
MTNRTFLARTTLTVGMLSTLVAGPVDAQQAPPPPPEVTRTVEAFAGRWTMDGTMAMPGQSPQKTTLKMDCKKTAMGKAVACSLSGPFEASALVAYDFYSKAVHFMAVTSNDEIHDHKCHWVSDKKLACDPLKGGMGGMPITEDLEFIIGPRKLGFRGAVTLPDGGKATCEFMSK